jgi:hypothetical protein
MDPYTTRIYNTTIHNNWLSASGSIYSKHGHSWFTLQVDIYFLAMVVLACQVEVHLVNVKIRVYVLASGVYEDCGRVHAATYVSAKGRRPNF